LFRFKTVANIIKSRLRPFISSLNHIWNEQSGAVYSKVCRASFVICHQLGDGPQPSANLSYTGECRKCQSDEHRQAPAEDSAFHRPAPL